MVHMDGSHTIICEGYLRQQCLDKSGQFEWKRKYFSLLYNGELEITKSKQRQSDHDDIPQVISIITANSATPWTVSSSIAGYGFDIVWLSGSIWSFIDNNESSRLKWIESINNTISVLNHKETSVNKDHIVNYSISDDSLNYNNSFYPVSIDSLSKGKSDQSDNSGNTMETQLQTFSPQILQNTETVNKYSDNNRHTRDLNEYSYNADKKKEVFPSTPYQSITQPLLVSETLSVSSIHETLSNNSSNASHMSNISEIPVTGNASTTLSPSSDDDQLAISSKHSTSSNTSHHSQSTSLSSKSIGMTEFSLENTSTASEKRLFYAPHSYIMTNHDNKENNYSSSDNTLRQDYSTVDPSIQPVYFTTGDDYNDGMLFPPTNEAIIQPLPTTSSRMIKSIQQQSPDFNEHSSSLKTDSHSVEDSFINRISEGKHTLREDNTDLNSYHEASVKILTERHRLEMTCLREEMLAEKTR